AKRMSEATMFPASTIHRFLKWQKEQNRFQVNEYNKSKVEFVIIDEASMIDTYLMDSLLKGLSVNCKIIVVGDDHQLPSVGPGDVLHDIIESDMLEVVKLKDEYRQDEGSNILNLAYDIRKKTINEDIFNIKDDLTFIRCLDSEVITNIIDIYNTYKDLDYHELQILVPMYKGLNGIDIINDKIQELFNKKSSNKKEIRVGEVIFREGDKVIQLTNMPDENVYNGDIGIISEITNSKKKEINIDFDGNVVKYTPSNFNNFRLAYAISIHKSQGSEFDVVIIPIVKGYNKMLYQKLIYTAVTRTKSKLYLIGDINALKYSASNDRDDNRRTTIKDYLINGIK
ncbi:MAG: AAA family ATPase, partial [Bacilli bacterium]|nr:AAA family ATPase [Bacilli bacterium]